MLPILVLLLVMAIDFGRVFFGWVALQNASRIAADFAASRSTNWAENEDLYRSLVRGDLEAINCFPADDGQWDDGDIPDPTYPQGMETGDPAVVSLTCSFDLLTPLANSILGSPVTLGAESSFPIHKTIQQALPPPSVPALPTPTPGPSQSQSPQNCLVPQTVGGSRNTARNLWAGRGFAPANLLEASNGNFTVGSQTRTAETSIPCSSQMTISESASLTPAPTPSPTPVPPPPTPTPIPTPTPVPTPTPIPCTAPVASFTYAPANPNRQTTVQFTNTSTARADCPITSYLWSFGDNTTSAAPNPTKRYNYGGNDASRQFTVRLTVTNSAGSHFVEQVITVVR